MGAVLVVIGIIAISVTGIFLAGACWFLTENGFAYFLTKRASDPDADPEFNALPDEEIYKYLKIARNIIFVLFLISLGILLGGIMMSTPTVRY